MKLKLDDNLLDQLLIQAKESPRKRSHKNIHSHYEEPVQRLCIGLTKGTYIRPHHHPQNNKWELVLVLRGSVCLVIFNKEGTIIERLSLGAGETVYGIEMEPGTWHTLFPLTDEAVMLEIKEGPYTPTEKNDFASWAPGEGETGVEDFLNWLEKAETGDKYTTSDSTQKAGF